MRSKTTRLVNHPTISLSEPHLSGIEWEYVKDCLDSGWVSSAGSYVDRFEGEVARLVGTRYAVATTSGTAALHVALLGAGVKQGDEVLVSSLSFVAPANAVTYVGAHPVFVDAHPYTWQMDVELVEAFLTERCAKDGARAINTATGRPVTAILPVHILGHPVDMDPLVNLAAAFDLAIIEDATESLGATYKGTSLGALGIAGCLSFNGNKLVTTGGGGMVVTNDEGVAHHVRHLTTQAKSHPTEYIHDEVGFNYRLSNIQAALGCGQLETFQDRVNAKVRIAETYRETLRDLEGIRFMPEAEWANPVYWLSTILVDAAPAFRSELMSGFHRNGIEVRPLWQPLHRSPAHSDSDCLGGEVAEDIYARSVSLPSSVGLSDKDQQRVIEVLRSHSATL